MAASRDKIKNETFSKSMIDSFRDYLSKIDESDKLFSEDKLVRTKALNKHIMKFISKNKNYKVYKEIKEHITSLYNQDSPNNFHFSPELLAKTLRENFAYVYNEKMKKKFLSVFVRDNNKTEPKDEEDGKIFVLCLAYEHDIANKLVKISKNINNKKKCFNIDIIKRNIAIRKGFVNYIKKFLKENKLNETSDVIKRTNLTYLHRLDFKDMSKLLKGFFEYVRNDKSLKKYNLKELDIITTLGGLPTLGTLFGFDIKKLDDINFLQDNIIAPAYSKPVLDLSEDGERGKGIDLGDISII